MNSATIDIGHCWPSNKLFARKLWEQLFRMTDAGSFRSLDNFLCDLDIFEEMFAKHGPQTFYWEFHRRTGITTITDFDPEEQDCYRIDYVPAENRITITETR
jgi:hypothetical protein